MFYFFHDIKKNASLVGWHIPVVSATQQDKEESSAHEFKTSLNKTARLHLKTFFYVFAFYSSLPYFSRELADLVCWDKWWESTARYHISTTTCLVQRCSQIDTSTEFRVFNFQAKRQASGFKLPWGNSDGDASTSQYTAWVSSAPVSTNWTWKWGGHPPAKVEKPQQPWPPLCLTWISSWLHLIQNQLLFTGASEHWGIRSKIKQKKFLLPQLSQKAANCGLHDCPSQGHLP